MLLLQKLLRYTEGRNLYLPKKAQLMKKILLIIITSFCSCQIWAQTANAVLFTENGEKFTAILNGIRQNDRSETNVKITGLNAEYYKLKVIFDNNAFGERNFNLAVQIGNESTYSIKKNSKGEYVLRFISTVLIADAPPTSSTQREIEYTNNPSAESSNTRTVTHQTTTTTTVKGGHSNPDDINFNMGVNVGEKEGNVNINMSGIDDSNSNSTTTTTQTTTTTTSTNNIHQHEQPVPPPPAYLPGYNGPYGCPVPLSQNDFNELKQTIKTKSFEDTKMTIAKQVVLKQCLFVSQVKEIMQLFSFEESKLEFAKYSYNHTYDLGNYFKVNDVFTFESSIDDLNEYIQSK